MQKYTQRWVVKIGSALLTDNGRGLNHQAIAGWVEQIAELRKQNIDVILVSSGAVAAGMSALGLKQRPKEIHGLQAAAAVGQMGLIQSYEQCFKIYDIQTAQILLTHDDLSNRQRYLNARSTMLALLEMGVVPVVNENDTVVTDEIRFGDNDTLGALVANLIEADTLVILTDQNGLFDADPRDNPNAKLIETAQASDPLLKQVASGSKSGLGRGGMITKVTAAELAARSGARTLIASGNANDVLLRIMRKDSVGTTLLPEANHSVARKQWLAGHLQMKGELVLDAGAVQVLKSSGGSLLPVGVTAVRGQFSRGEMVSCVDDQGQQIAGGLVNYSAEEAQKICATKSEKIEKILGFINEPELIHRDNMFVV